MRANGVALRREVLAAARCLSVGAEYRLTIEESSGQPSEEAAGQLPEEPSGPAQAMLRPITDAAPGADGARLF
ncbi:hypothetical protein [Streptomyces cyaneofuscatus]|uniref:hypothetical protein n=1 Tax=Streptomyces cyaneofuscatus TaxID=66883 RepID=UPI0037985651